MTALSFLRELPKERLAIAFSGGGDSTALVHMLRNRDPQPAIFIVDHALRPGSRAEAESAKKFAQDLGLDADILTWDNGSPTTAVQRKARQARYALLGRACHDRDITHLVTGHTQDDQAETVLMRFDRGTGWRGAAGMSKQAVSPLWPELAGITLHRPLLDHSRGSLRDYNIRHNLPWSDDPSNENRDFTRIRARDKLRRYPALKADMLSCAGDLQPGKAAEALHFTSLLRQHLEISSQGIFHLNRSVPAPLLSILLRAASGTGGPIESRKLAALKTEMFRPEFKAATLGGASVIKAAQGAIIGPDPALVIGRAGISPLGAILWPAGRRRLWAGRYWIKANTEAVTVQPLSGRISKLPKDAAKALRSVPAPFRPSLPLLTRASGEILAVGSLWKAPDIDISAAMAPRLHSMFPQL